MMGKLDFENIPVFQFIPRDVVNQLKEYLSSLDLRSEEVLLEYGQQVDSLFVVVEGCIEVYTKGFETYICTLTKGAPIGEMTLIEPGESSSASIRAGDEGATLWRCRHEDFKRLVLDQDYVAYCFYKGVCAVLSQRLRRTNSLARENVDRGVAIIQEILRQSRLSQRIDDVKGKIQAMEGTVASTLSTAIATLDELTVGKDAQDREALQTVRQAVSHVLEDDMRDNYRISKELELLAQCLENVKTAMYG